MKIHIRYAVPLLLAAILLLSGCAAATGPIPTETAPPPTVAAPAATETPIHTVLKVGDDGIVIIPDESVPLGSAAAEAPEPALTRDQAVEIAIRQAGLTQNDVSFLFAKEDLEDGVKVFEVSFRSGSYAYEIEIARETGEVLSYDKEDFRKD